MFLTDSRNDVKAAHSVTAGGYWAVSGEPGICQEVAELLAVQSAYEKEPQCGHMVLDRSRFQLSLLEQVSLVAVPSCSGDYQLQVEMLSL